MDTDIYRDIDKQIFGWEVESFSNSFCYDMFNKNYK